jgi:hypothetical protein
MSLEVKVTPVLDSMSIDSHEFDDVPVYEGEIENEATVLPQDCFLGAWYRKFVSSVDYWLGIEGIITLGEFTPDEDRFNLDGKHRYMDNPSVYMGGKASLESDCGLNWNIGYEKAGDNQVLDYGSKKVAWRPFWRYIYNDVKDENGNVLRGSYNSWNVCDPSNLGYYYLPGDTIKMSVYSVKPDYLQMRIEVIKPTSIPKYVKQREQYNLKNNMPYTFYSPIFHSKGHGVSKAEFKRVNSIDQYNNEGYKVSDTKATVSKATWHECYLYRRINGKLYKVPFTTKRAFSMICPTRTAMSVNYDDVDVNKGGENIILHPQSK